MILQTTFTIDPARVNLSPELVNSEYYTDIDWDCQKIMARIHKGGLFQIHGLFKSVD